MLSNQPNRFEEDQGSRTLDQMVAESDSMQQVIELIRINGQTKDPVLLSGEIGTGKAGIARAIFELGNRTASPWMVINCATESPEIIEEMVFGNEDRSSAVQADQGTLYFEEVDRLSETAQLRLLQLLTEGRFKRPSALRWVPLDVRVIASSHADLHKAVAEGRFREDLFWQLNSIPIEVPPLRRRRDDIELLAKKYMRHYARTYQKKIARIVPKMVRMLIEYSFPGNLPELESYIRRAVLMAKSDQLTQDLFPASITGFVSEGKSVIFRPSDDEALIREFVQSQLSKCDPGQGELLSKIVEPLEKELIIQVLDMCQQTQTKAAKRLGINRNTLFKKMGELGLTKPKTEGDS